MGPGVRPRSVCACRSTMVRRKRLVARTNRQSSRPALVSIFLWLWYLSASCQPSGLGRQRKLHTPTHRQQFFGSQRLASSFRPDRWLKRQPRKRRKQIREGERGEKMMKITFSSTQKLRSDCQNRPLWLPYQHARATDWKRHPRKASATQRNPLIAVLH